MRQLTRRQRMSAIILCVIALSFITLDLGGGGLRDAHDGVRGTLGSLYRGTDAVFGPVRRWMQGVPSAGTNEATIRTLLQENARLRGRLAAQAADGRVSEQVARLQRSADGTSRSVVPARVIAFGPGQGFDWTVTLDAGRHSGIRTGQSVTDGAGLVGRVLHADQDSSVVLLAADSGSGVGARDLRNGEVGVATGAGSAGFTYVPLDPHAHLNVGDQLATGPSGSSSYVTGLAVGTITSVRTAADGTTSATVRPAVAPTTVDLVGVIIESTPVVADRPALAPARSGR